MDAPWSAWGSTGGLRAARRALGDDPVDLAIDFQGDFRVLLLVAFSKARLRAGYGDTGGRYLLTHPASWDEGKSWYRQNLELVRTLFPDADAGNDGPLEPYNFVTEADRREAAECLRRNGLESAPRPLIGIHPSAGRAIKEWEDGKFRALAAALSGKGTVVYTGASADRPRVERLAAGSAARTLVGVPLATFAAVLETLDVFVTGDTGPMHLSHAVGTPNVALFGPSDPVRYGPEEGVAARRVVRHSLYCSPCNMIRRPPRECASVPAPECMASIEVSEVLEAVEASLGSGRRGRG